MAKRSGRDYKGFSPLVSLILVIIPITAWIMGVVTRFQEGKIVAALVRVFFGGFIWIIDIICYLLTGRILRLLNI